MIFSSIQKGITYSSIKTFTKLPLNILKLYINTTTFKSVLRKFLVTNACYSKDEFLSTNCGVNYHLTTFVSFIFNSKNNIILWILYMATDCILENIAMHRFYIYNCTFAIHLTSACGKNLCLVLLHFVILCMFSSRSRMYITIQYCL